MRLISLMVGAMLLTTAGQVAAQQEGGAFDGALKSEGPLNFHYVVKQDDGEPITVETTLAVGENETLVVNDELVLEIWAPEDFGVNYLTRTLLKKRFNMDQLIIHNAEQDLAPDDQPRRNAYVVCGNSVTFLSPVPAILPGCDS